MFRNPLTDGVVVLIVLILFFGPKRLPMLSRSIGESIKEFKGGISEASSSSGDKSQLTTTESEASPSPRETVDTGSERSS